MLSWIRKQTGTWWVKAIYIGVAITFFGGFGILSSTRIKSCLGMAEDDEPTAGNEAALAWVEGEPITEQKFGNRFNRYYQRRAGDWQEKHPDQPFPEENRLGIQKDVMKDIINEKLILKEADRLGLKVSSAELQSEIAQRLSSILQGPFDPAKYQEFLRSQGLTEADFEKIIREEVLQTKVLMTVVDGVDILPDEIEERYAHAYEAVKVEYLVLDPPVFQAKLEPGDSTVAKYFTDHPSDFYLGETRKVEYVSWDVKEVSAGVTVNETEIQKYYEEGKDRYLTMPEQVSAQHILIKVDKNAPAADIDAAREKIYKIYMEVLEPGSDFSALARTYSEDSSKDQGGSVGWFAKSDYAEKFNLPVMLPEFEKASFELQAGEVSMPVQTTYGFHIIKLEGRKPAEYTPLDKVRTEVLDNLKHSKALSRAEDQAQAMKAILDTGLTFEAAALETGKTPELSDWYQGLDDEVFGLEDSKVIIEKTMELGLGEVGDPLTGLDHVFLVKVIELRPERPGTLAEVKNRIQKLLKPKVQIAATRKQANDFLLRLQTGAASLSNIALETGTKVEKVEYQPRGLIKLPVPGLEDSDTVSSVVMGLSMNQPWPMEPLFLRDKVIILHLLEALAPDLTKFEQEKATAKDSYLIEKQKAVIVRWKENLSKGKVKYSARWRDMNETSPGAKQAKRD